MTEVIIEIILVDAFAEDKGPKMLQCVLDNIGTTPFVVVHHKSCPTDNINLPKELTDQLEQFPRRLTREG